jgi:hypothetical protein
MKKEIVKIDENTMGIVIQSRKFGIVTFSFDSEDLPRIKAFSWCLQKHLNGFYAFATIGGKRIYLHQLIMSFPIGMMVDHKSRVSTDNTKNNLRVATHSQNIINQTKPKNLKHTKWGYVVEGKIKNEYFYLGYEKDLQKAKQLYNSKITEIAGEFARTI